MTSSVLLAVAWAGGHLLRGGGGQMSLPWDTPAATDREEYSHTDMTSPPLSSLIDREIFPPGDQSAEPGLKLRLSLHLVSYDGKERRWETKRRTSRWRDTLTGALLSQSHPPHIDLFKYQPRAEGHAT